MNRTIGSYLDQRIQLNQVQVRRFKARIRQVLFAGHSFAVFAAGYSGPDEIPADYSIDFGTTSRPLVFAGDETWIEMDDAGRWHAKEYIPTKRCMPTTSPNVPNIPLPTYRPPIDTNTHFDIPRVDASFSPHSIAMAQLVPSSKMPPIIPPIGASSSYDFQDGWYQAGTGKTTAGLRGASCRRYKIIGIAAVSSQSDWTFNAYFNEVSATLVLVRYPDSSWQLQRFSGGVLVNTWTLAAGSNIFTASFTGTSIITMSSAGLSMHTEIVNGTTNAVTLDYGLLGTTY